MTAETAEMVPKATAPKVNARIEARTRAAITHAGTNPREIGHRLRELDREWDIERALAANAATLALIGLGLGLAADRRFLALPVAVSAFPREILPTPRKWAERNYRDLVHWGDMEKGGHFAAWEQPQAFVSELRAAFGKMR